MLVCEIKQHSLLVPYQPAIFGESIPVSIACSVQSAVGELGLTHKSLLCTLELVGRGG